MSHYAPNLQSNFRAAGGVLVPSDTDDDRLNPLDSAFLDDSMVDEDEIMDSGDEEDEELEEVEDEDDCCDEDGDDEAEQIEKDAKLQQSQSELRKRIVDIQADTKIPAAEKAKKFSQWSSRQKAQTSRTTLADNKLQDKRNDFSVVLDADKVKTYHDKAAGILGCKHYQRASKLQAHCCGKWYACRFCHDEVSDHNIIRNLIVTMMCMYCNQVQPAGQDCINAECQRRVSKYYCKECKLWDDDPRKNIYHCYDCGICRIGKGLGIDYFHCKKCNVCMAISLKGRHKCIERNLESDCPICGEYMFTSTTTVIFMPCGHCIHYKCHQEYIQTSYQCPTCFKSLANMSEYFKRIDAMLAQHQMPPEYANTKSFIYCNDCEKKCYAKFHFLYHKCVHCKGYNTKVLHTVEATEGQPLNEALAEAALEVKTGAAASSTSLTTTAQLPASSSSTVSAQQAAHHHHHNHNHNHSHSHHHHHHHHNNASIQGPSSATVPSSLLSVPTSSSSSVASIPSGDLSVQSRTWRNDQGGAGSSSSSSSSGAPHTH
ncbi:zinc-ribbon-domain-containing protein [Chytridium lagenaria]|nr:zinc-ribbon-domain-containing protein [Chytridium lagenaria]